MTPPTNFIVPSIHNLPPLRRTPLRKNVQFSFEPRRFPGEQNINGRYTAQKKAAEAARRRDRLKKQFKAGIDFAVESRVLLKGGLVKASSFSG